MTTYKKLYYASWLVWIGVLAIIAAIGSPLWKNLGLMAAILGYGFIQYSLGAEKVRVLYRRGKDE